MYRELRGSSARVSDACNAITRWQREWLQERRGNNNQLRERNGRSAAPLSAADGRDRRWDPAGAASARVIGSLSTSGP